MDELLKKIEDMTGLGADKAKQVIDTVFDYVGDKLPAPLAAQVKGFLDADGDDDAAGGDSDGGMVDKAKDALGGLGGLLGGND